MPLLNRRSITIVSTLLAFAALAITTPASAQFGGLKKKLKGDAAAKAAEKATGTSDGPTAPAPGHNEETVVLTPDVVDRLIGGLKAGAAERESAKNEDTPYGRYLKAKAAYEEAKPKCQAAMQPAIQKLAADEKKSAKYQKYIEKMNEAGGRQDYKTQQAYNDSAMAMIDASCVVKEPQQPDDYYDAKRAIDNQAEQATLKTSGFTGRELGQLSDRAIAILTGITPPGGEASAGEKAAVKAKDPELKSLLGIRDAQEQRVAKQAPAPAPAAVDTAPSTAAVTPPAGTAALNECMMKNVQKHEAEIEALGKRGEAANKAGDMALMMAIADSIQQIQFAGCRRP
jgi:hypothetical protein